MFKTYLELGFTHILDPQGIDHILFLIALTLPFSLKDWKRVIILVTAFTIGHSVTLALAAFDIIAVNSRIIEILIAVSIFMTALINLIRPSYQKEDSMISSYILALGFGLIHGLGFSNFFKSLFGDESIVKPLLSFNIGVECAQVLIVGICLITSWAVSIKMYKQYWTYLWSIIIAVLALKMILERL